MNIIFVMIIVAFVAWYAINTAQARQRELGRFSATLAVEDEGIEKKIDHWFEKMGGMILKKKKPGEGGGLTDKAMDSRLKAAGFETIGDQGKFVLGRLLCYLSWFPIAIMAWTSFTPYYAVVTSIFSLGFVVITPYLWLSRRTIHRSEEIQRELPLVIDLTNLATSAGWDIAVALERVIDALAPEYPNHPLIKEFRRARWLASSGYTWSEGLERVAKKMGDDTVSRVTQALTQAMEQGGDRSAQLGGIAQDAQRSYYTTLDKRLAAVPVKSLVITMVLFLVYFVILLAPAVSGPVGN